MAFTYYNTKPITPELTVAEIIASLSGAQKIAILDGFTFGVKAFILGRRAHIDLFAVERLYRKIAEIEALSRLLMRGEVVVTPAVVEDGEIVTPAVMNTPPSSAVELLTQVQDDFSDDFTAPQVQAILTRMVEYSKYDGTGDWAFYSTEVIK